MDESNARTYVVNDQHSGVHTCQARNIFPVLTAYALFIGMRLLTDGGEGVIVPFLP